MKPVLYHRPAWYLAEKQQIPGLVYLIIPPKEYKVLNSSEVLLNILSFGRKISELTNTFCFPIFSF
jgi:hypothetical protein